MVARDPEQEMMIAITTRARRVDSVLISKSNFMEGGDGGGGAGKGVDIESLMARCGRKGVQEQSAAMMGGDDLPNSERGS
jgi:hypothetical protein